MKKQRYPVGIDLGTTFSSLAYVDDKNRVQALRLPDGEFALASAIYFRTSAEIVVGSEALNYAVVYPDQIARAFKRHMGDPSYRPVFHGRTYTPQELSAMILRRLAEAAAPTVGVLEDVVISVPFVFDEVRRRATQDAGRIAGFKKVDLVDEPVAAAMAYGHALVAGGDGLFGATQITEAMPDDYVLVYDLGGGTFDATIMRLGRDGVFEVLATDGDERLGGEDWDNILVEILCERLTAQTGDEPRGDKGLMQDLRLKAVEAKKALSERPRVEVVVSYEGRDLKLILMRGDFERKSRPLLERTLSTVEEMLRKKGMTWSHIDRILMVGGSSRMPQVPKLLEHTTRRKLDMSLSPDVAIAKGAALYAALRSGGRQMRVKEVITVNSHALGLMVIEQATNEIINHVLLKANEPTLKKVGQRYRVAAGKKAVSLTILLGEARRPDECVRLGQARITGVPENPDPKDVVEVTFCFLRNGLLQVAALYRPADGGEPRQVEFEVAIEGQMSEDNVNEAIRSLKGITMDN
jgi:molecular chaperone DnaK